ncbi:MAG: hypothetical protein PHQ28_00515 [Mycobacterium sp.]|nr:hypothetical protein [Mycobacterium sp.]
MADNPATKTRAPRSKAAAATVPTEPNAREATKRLTLDIPESLHFAMKMLSVETNVPMVDEVTPLLMNHYADAMRRYRKR